MTGQSWLLVSLSPCPLFTAEYAEIAEEKKMRV